MRNGGFDMRCMCSKAHKAMIITLVRLFNSEFDLKLSTCAATIHKIVSESIQPILFKTLELQWNFSYLVISLGCRRPSASDCHATRGEHLPWLYPPKKNFCGAPCVESGTPKRRNLPSWCWGSNPWTQKTALG